VPQVIRFLELAASCFGHIDKQIGPSRAAIERRAIKTHENAAVEAAEAAESLFELLNLRGYSARFPFSDCCTLSAFTTNND
jgi:hypothetical protein